MRFLGFHRLAVRCWGRVAQRVLPGTDRRSAGTSGEGPMTAFVQPDPAPIGLTRCMAGEATVGKTSLIRRSVLDEYDDRYIATLGTKITKKVMSVQDPKGAGLVTVHAILWDIMGTPTLRDLLKEAYYHGAEGIFAVADQTRKETLAALDAWARSIRSVAGDIPTFGLVNKKDLD